MLASRFTLIRKTLIIEIFGDQGGSYFWEARFLPRWLPLLLGLCVGLISAFLLANELWHFAILLALAVPAALLFSRYPFSAILLWILVLPYFLNEPTTAGRFIYWIVHRAVIPATLGIVILSDSLGIRKRKPIRLDPTGLTMVLFFGLTLVSIFLFNQNPIQSVIKSYDLLFVPFCMYWLIRVVAPTKEDLKRFLWVALITVLAQCVIGLLSWFAPEMLLSKWRTGLEGARTVGTLRNTAVYTSTLLFFSLLLFQQAMHSKMPVIRLGLLFTFGLAMYCVFMSFSRGSWLGGSIVLLGLLAMYPKVVVRLIVVLLVSAYLLSSGLLADQVAWAYERTTGEAATRTAEDRLITNSASIRMIDAKPLFGWGFGNYDEYDRRFQERVGDVRVRHDGTSHNTYLTIMAEMGSIGLLLYIFPLGWWFLLSLKIWPRLPRVGFWSRHLLVMWWLLLLHMVVVTNFMDMIRFHHFGTTIWWMALAFIANMVSSYFEPGDLKAPRWARNAARHA